MTSRFSFSRNETTGVATIAAAGSAGSAVLASFNFSGRAVAWFVSEALNLAYVVHEPPADGDFRVLMAPLGCGNLSSCSSSLTDTALDGGKPRFDDWNPDGMPLALVAHLVADQHEWDLTFWAELETVHALVVDAVQPQPRLDLDAEGRYAVDVWHGREGVQIDRLHC